VDDFGLGLLYRFFEMGLVAGKSDVVAMVLKGVLSEPGLVFGFGLHGKGFFGFGWLGRLR
jgi:hypothetical protein